jgi:hypothetical protein
MNIVSEKKLGEGVWRPILKHCKSALFSLMICLSTFEILCAVGGGGKWM